MTNKGFTNLTMIGPGSGHNVHPFLEALANIQDINTTYIHTTPLDKNIEGRLSTIEWSRRFGSLRRVAQHLRGQAQLIWLHGAYDLLQALFINGMRHPQSFLNLNIWGQQVAEISLQNNMKGCLYRKLLRDCESIQCNWFGTFETLKDLKLSQLHVSPWGLHRAFFEKNDATVASPELANWLRNLPEDKFTFFFPKSLNTLSCHSLIVDACELLVQKNVKHFKVIFWPGNHLDLNIKKHLQEKIEAKELSDHIEFVNLPFVSFHDMKKIWLRMDCGLQIVRKDQLSTTLLEPMALEIPIIASDILPYRRLNQKLGVSLELVELEVGDLARAMEKEMMSSRAETKRLQIRSQIITENFDFDKNLNKSLSAYLAGKIPTFDFLKGHDSTSSTPRTL